MPLDFSGARNFQSLACASVRLHLVFCHDNTTPGAAGAQTVAPVEASVVIHGHDHGDVEVHGGEVVIDAVARSRVDDARAVVERDVVGIDELALFRIIT